MMSVFSILGVLAAAGAHALAAAGVSIPTSAIVSLTVAMIPLFIMAILTHPTRRWRLGGVEAEIETEKTPLWLDVLLYGGLAYLVVLWAMIPERHFSLSGHLDRAHQMIATWTDAVLYTAAFALRWTARQLNGP